METTIPLVATAIIIAVSILYFKLRKKQLPKLRDSYDYVIIGAGSAGCVLANRLSENKEKTVLLLEAGSSDDVDRMIGIPAVVVDLQKTKVDWGFQVQPQEHSCKAWNSSLLWPRGKVLGGTSSINGMAYIRGDSTDYDSWEKLGAEGWSWNDVLPYFLKSEDYKVPGHQDSQYHSTGGLLTVTDQTCRQQLSEDFITAGKELGYKEVDVSSGKDIIGFGKMPATIANNTRASTSKAFLIPAMGRPNLTVLTDAHVTKIEIEYKRAVGVHFLRNKTPQYVGATSEVIVSAGSISSPQILMLSGIGPKSHLEDVGIECIQDLPVGENLQDHYAALVKATVSSTFKDDVVVISEAEKYYHILNYLIGRKSLLASNGLESGCFLRTGLDEDSTWPDLQLHFVATLNPWGRRERELLSVKNDDLKPIFYQHVSLDEQMREPGVTIIPIVLHPKSIGYIKLRDSNPRSPPIIDPRYLEDEYDVKVLVEGMRLIHKLTETECFKAKGVKLVDIGMPGISAEEFSEENLSDYVRHFGMPFYHPVGTCKMGSADDPTTVVDPQLSACMCTLMNEMEQASCEYGKQKHVSCEGDIDRRDMSKKPILGINNVEQTGARRVIRRRYSMFNRRPDEDGTSITKY